MDVIETDTADVQVNSAGATSYVNNYKIMSMLGEGTFSKVYLCQSEAGNEFALKVINKSILKRKREYKRVDGKLVLSNAFQKVQKEVAIMKKLAHSNLVRLYEVIDSPADDKLFLVLELIRGGQIMYWDEKQFRYFDRKSSTGVLTKDTVRECLRDVVAALDFLHRNHICHRDIKPENILLSDNQYKLADFGVAHMKDDEPSAAVKLRSTEGTYHFLGPECTTGDEYDPYQVDVWALGVTMHALLVGTLPFGTSVASLSDVMTSIREDPLILPQKLDSECAQLLAQLLEKDPNLRITVPQLMTHPWISGSGGELNRQASVEVLVTQQEIEAAFTPVNNFILVMKLKMKMSTRLNKVRKSLASNSNSTRRIDTVPVTAHVPVSSSQATEDGSGELDVSKAMEIAPSEQPHRMAERLQRRSSRVMESISHTVGSLSTSLTRRKSQLGAISPVLNNAATTTSFPVLGGDSPGKEESHGRPSGLVPKLSRRNSRHVECFIPDIPHHTDSSQKSEVLSSEEQRDDISPAKSDAHSSSSSPLKSSRNISMRSLNGNSSPDKSSLLQQRLAKRKSSSLRGFVRTVEIPKGATIPETTSPTSKKRRESQPGNDPSSSTTAQNAVQHFDSPSPVDKDTSPIKVEPSSSTVGELNISPSRVDGTATISPQTTTRPVVLARRLSKRSSRSFRGVITALNTSSSGEVTKDPGTSPSVLAHSPAKVDFDVATVESNGQPPLYTGHSPIRTESTSPFTLSRLSRQNSTSFKALVSTPEVVVPGSASLGSEEMDDGSVLASDAASNGANESTESKSPSESRSSSSSHFFFRRTSTSFRTIAPKVDVSGAGENVNGTSNLSPGSCSSTDPLEVTSPRAHGVDELHSLQMSPSGSPLSSPKHKTTVETDVLQSLPKVKLPVLEIHSPVSSPVASLTRAADVGETHSNEVTPRKRPSSAGRLSPVKVAPLSRKRSSSFHFDGPSDEGDKNEDPISTSATTVAPIPSSTSLPAPDSADARPTFSPKLKPALPLSEEAKSSPSPHRKLHRNRSVSSGLDEEDPTLTRKSSLARALDEYLTSNRVAERETPVAEAQRSPVTPNRRYTVHVPPLPRQEDQIARSATIHGRHHHVSPVESTENPSPLEPKADLTPEKSPPPRKKSLEHAQDSMRSLFRGQSSLRLNTHAASNSRMSSIKTKVCAIM